MTEHDPYVAEYRRRFRQTDVTRFVWIDGVRRIDPVQVAERVRHATVPREQRERVLEEAFSTVSATATIGRMPRRNPRIA
jgi:hypothetical protein